MAQELMYPPHSTLKMACFIIVSVFVFDTFSCWFIDNDFNPKKEPEIDGKTYFTTSSVLHQLIDCNRFRNGEFTFRLKN